MEDQISQKKFARWLDIAASRADLIDREPASSKQCWFLASLAIKAGDSLDDLECGILNSQAILTKGRASALISEYLAAGRA